MNRTRELEKAQRRPRHRSKSGKKAGRISRWQLWSCCAASAAIVILCLYEAFYKGDAIPGGELSYLVLAAAALAFSLVIWRKSLSAGTGAKNKKGK